MPHPDQSPSVGAPFRVLVAEDNAVNQQVLGHYLTHFDVAFEIVANGLLAVEAARTSRYGMVLMDIQMPVMDGLTATRHIRKLPGREGSIPIYAVTAHTDDIQNQNYLAAGMNGVIPKPSPHRPLPKGMPTFNPMNCASVRLDEAVSLRC